MSESRTVVSVRFGKSEKTYDYFADFPVEVGQIVRAETRNGWTKVEVVDVKSESDRAKQSVQPNVETEPVEEEAR
ncbi:hypothetical protein [Chelativorans sp. AA-79]|uniref:hypothetical protein n=1 Tax=Chelativorans sp. AA-79 TaxID=3028735 RepID=UPI0023F94D2D|nr:hypothetical protein [Chelativorans sp. AA-79]WEX10332.1 hypothetical protein PVE73_05060 [Chelativorans sp. AA-79]